MECVAILRGDMNMFPNLFFNNRADISFTDRKLPCNCSDGHTVFMLIKNFYHIFFFKLRSARGFASWMSRSFFAFHINHIILMGANAQMLQIHTKRIIACVHDFFFSRMLVFKKKYRSTVSHPCFAIDGHASIAMTRDGTNPDMTCGGFFNFFKKALSGYFNIISIMRSPFFHEECCYSRVM